MEDSFESKSLDIDLKITDIHYHSEGVLVKFEGQYDLEYEFDYHILHSEIQQASKVKDSVGVGEFCLVEDSRSGAWYRGRVVQKKSHIYEVFLVDSGKMLIVDETSVASAIDELFQLPPKIVCGIFANILPVNKKWSPKALNYFSSLIGLQIKGHVQAILPHQIFLLDVPKIINDIIELKLGKCVDENTFHLIVEMLLELPLEPFCKQMPDLLPQNYMRSDSLFSNVKIQQEVQPLLSSLQPLLSVGKTEKVKILVAISPRKFYCQLLQNQTELDQLTTNMFSFYENCKGNVLSCDSLGVLCAARRRSGEWHRGVIQHILSDGRVKIWFMDFGTCEAVPSSFVLKLQPEFSSVPGFLFPCALSCLDNQDAAVRANQLRDFKEVLLTQSNVYVHIDLFSTDELLYYVTLHKQGPPKNNEVVDNDVVPKFTLSFKTECDDRSGDIQVQGSNSELSKNAQQSECPLDKNDFCLNCSPLTVHWKRAEINIDSVCVGFVVYVLNPSNFWVQTNEYHSEFEALMKRISDVYDLSEANKNLEHLNPGILEYPEPGKFCCAQYSKDRRFYRAAVREIEDNNIDVYFLDFGNTEKVPRSCVRDLLPEFQELPALAVYCSLANASPIEGMWTKRETDFFKKTVLDKSLTLWIIAKDNHKHFANVKYMNGTEHIDVLLFMVQEGYAEYWEVKHDQFLDIVRSCRKQKSRRNNTKCSSVAQKKKKSFQNCKLLQNNHAIKEQWESILLNKYGKTPEKSGALMPYKEFLFKPGYVFDVTCCHIISPGNFLCQMKTKLPELNNLMEQIQCCYQVQRYPYERGQPACVAKYSKNGKWYRGTVLRSVSDTEVDVVFVDYGYQESVLLSDLQAILPDFLVLECQAFRCCLSVVSESIFDPCNWTAKTCSDFEHFVLNFGEQLTCTISALMLRSADIYHLVDLRTPSISIQQFLFECGPVRFFPFQFTRSLVPSISLCTFFYSSFDLQVGCIEEICVTHICSPTKFYCQLNRNADEIDILLKKCEEVSQMARHTKQINSQNLCLVRYIEDSHFYRALTAPVGSSDYLPVYFVDFGNKQLVTKEELIPIPDHASELLFTPMQAIKCYLTDLEGIEIPNEINSWFDNNYSGKELKIVIVSKDTNRQIGVELYEGPLNINKKIKELLRPMQKCHVNLGITSRCAERTRGYKSRRRLGLYETDVHHQVSVCKRETNKTVSCSGDDTVLKEVGKKVTVDITEQSQSPRKPFRAFNTELRLQKRECKEPDIDSDNSDFVLKKTAANSKTKFHLLNPSVDGKSTPRPKYENLPQYSIQPRTKVLGYISSVTGLTSFYIHLSEDEDKLTKLAEELDPGTLTVHSERDVQLEEGDLVLAEYDVDCCIYRAVVRSIKSEESFEVEFIDYGNTTIVNASKIYKMREDFMRLPRLSIHCFLHKQKCVGQDEEWSSDTIAYFENKLNNQLLHFEILQQHGQQWEVDIIYNGKSVSDELMQREKGLRLQNVIFDQSTRSQLVDEVDKDTNGQCQKSEKLYLDEVFKTRSILESCSKMSCQRIKPGHLEKAEVGYISQDGHFCVALNQDEQILSHLEEMAAKEAENNSFLLADKIVEGLECLTKSKETLKWHRCEVVKKYANEEHMLVFFVDLGKYEIVPLCDTLMLSDEMRRIPKGTVPCTWSWIEKLGEMSFKGVAEMLKNNEIKILFLKYNQICGIWEVDILINEIPLLEYLQQMSHQGALEKLKSSKNRTVAKILPGLPTRPNSISWAPFQMDASYQGFVTSFTDPSNFSIQLEDSFKALKKLFQLLSDLPENLPAMPQELIIPGASCLIRGGSSGEWNRVEISEISKVSNTLAITFVDEGLSASIPISDIHKLKVIPEKLVKVPRLTYPCSLFGVSPAVGKNWSLEAKLKVLEFLDRRTLTFKLKQYHYEKKLDIDVFHERSSLADMFIIFGSAVYSKTESSFGSTRFVEHHLLNSRSARNPSKVSCQDSSETGISLLSDKEEKTEKSDGRLRCIHGHFPRQNILKSHCSRKKRWQKTLLCNIRRNIDYLFKCKKNLSYQMDEIKKLEHSCPAGLFPDAIHDPFASCFDLTNSSLECNRLSSGTRVSPSLCLT